MIENDRPAYVVGLLAVFPSEPIMGRYAESDR